MAGDREPISADCKVVRGRREMTAHATRGVVCYRLRRYAARRKITGSIRGFASLRLLEQNIPAWLRM
jgi:hypothetical protein